MNVKLYGWVHAAFRSGTAWCGLRNLDGEVTTNNIDCDRCKVITEEITAALARAKSKES